MGDGPNVFRSNPRNGDDVFSKFFGSSTPPGGSRFSGGSMSADDIFSSFGDSRAMSSGLRKAPPIEQKLPCSLEELYKGATKRIKVSREILNARGMIIPVEETLTIGIKAGWKKGTKITFPEKGNEQPNVIPSDLVIIIDEKPHSIFTRDGNDLVVTREISLADALTDYTLHLTTLDGRSLTIPINSVIHPTYEEVVPREGMPFPKEPRRRGNLRIKFNIKFPTRLKAEYRPGIKMMLSP